MLFKELGLSAELLHAVETQGYKTTTPIQQQAIAPILEGRDVIDEQKLLVDIEKLLQAIIGAIALHL